MTAPAWIPTQHARFMAEREKRARLKLNIGKPGHCRRCGKPDTRSLFICRNLRAIHCTACRKLNTADFYRKCEESVRI